MNPVSKSKLVALMAGDILALYAALLATLVLRYGNGFYAQLVDTHLEPFTMLFAAWILIFYISGLYDPKFLKNSFEFKKVFWYACAANFIVGGLFFYLIPAFGIAPKTNLVIFFVVFGAIGYAWRQSYNLLLGKSGAASKLLIIGSNKTAQEIVDHIAQNPQLGYEVRYWMKEGLADKEFDHLSQIILAHDINTIAIPAHLKKDAKSAKLIYQILLMGIEVTELSRVYESMFNKVPLAELEEVWFLEHLAEKHRMYEVVNTPLEVIAALLLLIVLSPLLLLIAILIKLTSPGPVIFTQARIGHRGAEFIIYKFRSMPVDAEKEGPQWAQYHHDARATWFGAFLRRTHLDELPQLWNILKGEISFVGPRPERPEFVEKLRKELPYYNLRHLTKPGVTGWAQINYRYAASVTDSYQKLQYDIYYIKNNSPLLDFLIVLRTIKFLITNHS